MMMFMMMIGDKKKAEKNRNFSPFYLFILSQQRLLQFYGIRDFCLIFYFISGVSSKKIPVKL